MFTTHQLAVIPDVHMRRKMLHFAIDLNDQGYPLVFLGDYSNKGPHGNDPTFLRELFAFAKTHHAILLVGNHDLAYLYPNQKDFQIEGYEAENAGDISTIYQEYKNLFTFLHREDKYLFSHAGLGADFIATMQQRHPHLSLNGIIAELNTSTPPELFYRSAYNSGADPFDGPLWIRPEQYDGVLETEGITQVVGHSSQATIRMKHNLLMIDVQLPLILEW